MTPISLFFYIAVKLNIQNAQQLYSKIAKIWAKKLTQTLNIELIANTPPIISEEQALITSNHQSYLDIMLSYTVWIQQDIVPSFVLKRSLFIILPQLALPILLTHNISINRDKKHERLDV